jgi:hypothetical protein
MNLVVEFGGGFVDGSLIVGVYRISRVSQRNNKTSIYKYEVTKPLQMTDPNVTPPFLPF